jgi:hypothetical protein
MAGRGRLPGGTPRKASQRQRRLSAPSRVVVERSWRAGDQVRWRDRDGMFLRAVDDGLADIRIEARTCRVVVGELRPA